MHRAIKLFCVVLLLIVSTACTAQKEENSHQGDIEIPAQETLPEVNESDIFQVDIPTPRLEEHIDVLNNELFSELGILPVAQWYEYSVIPEECIQTKDSYTEIVRLQHSGEMFTVDTKVQLNFEYLASENRWIYKSAEIPEDVHAPLFTCNIEGIWTLEGVKTQELFPYESYGIDLEILIYDYETADQDGAELGQFHWVASNLETSSLEGTGYFTANDPLWLILTSEQMYGGWGFDIVADNGRYNEFGDPPFISYTLVKQA